jgi:hypothetical protein
MLECPTAPELLLGVIDRQFPACSGNLNTILIRTEGNSEESAKPNYALVAGERDFDIHLVVGAAESGDYGIPVGKIDVGQRIVEIEENLEGEGGCVQAGESGGRVPRRAVPHRTVRVCGVDLRSSPAPYAPARLLPREAEAR